MPENQIADLQRTIYATAHFRYLRGLAMLPVGLLCIVFPLFGHLSGTHRTLAMLGFLLSCLAAVAGIRYISLYYTRRYGTVARDRTARSYLAGMLVWAAIYLGCAMLDHRQPGLGFEAVWLAAFFWGIYMSSEGRRWHYLVIAAAFAAFTPFWAQIGDWQTVLIGLAFVAGGLMDHMVLARLLPAPPEDLPSGVLQ